MNKFLSDYSQTNKKDTSIWPWRSYDTHYGDFERTYFLVSR